MYEVKCWRKSWKIGVHNNLSTVETGNALTMHKDGFTVDISFRFKDSWG